MAQIPSTMSSPAVQVAQAPKDREAQVKSRGGVASPNPPSTNLPASVKLESSQPPLPVPITGQVPTMNPVETPRAAEDARTVNNTPPNMSVNLREDFVNETLGSKPLAPNLIADGAGQQTLTSARPNDADQRLSGANPVGSGPVLPPDQPEVTPPVVGPSAPEF